MVASDSDYLLYRACDDVITARPQSLSSGRLNSIVQEFRRNRRSDWRSLSEARSWEDGGALRSAGRGLPRIWRLFSDKGLRKLCDPRLPIVRRNVFRRFWFVIKW